MKYETQDGRLLLPDYVSLHHVLWPRRDYKTPAERTVRAANGFSVRMAHEVHRELHATVPPPPKPGPDLAHELIRFTNAVTPRTPYDHFRLVADRLFDIVMGSECERNVEEAALLLGNFAHQMAYIEEGRVEPVKEIA